MKTNRKWRWVTRNARRILCSQYVRVWASVKEPVSDRGSYCGGEYTCVCVEEFALLTGIVVKEGECLRVEFVAKVV